MPANSSSDFPPHSPSTSWSSPATCDFPLPKSVYHQPVVGSLLLTIKFLLHTVQLTDSSHNFKFGGCVNWSFTTLKHFNSAAWSLSWTLAGCYLVVAFHVRFCRFRGLGLSRYRLRFRRWFRRISLDGFWRSGSVILQRLSWLSRFWNGWDRFLKCWGNQWGCWHEWLWDFKSRQCLRTGLGIIGTGWSRWFIFYTWLMFSFRHWRVGLTCLIW